MPKKPTRKTLPKDLDELLEAAAKDGDDTAVVAALERCLPDARGGYGKGTLLMNGHCTLELARWAIARGTEINAGNTWGDTPLHESASRRFHHTLKPAELIELGADVHRTNNSGLTPLHSAADGNNADAVEVLLQHGADVHARDEDEHTPLEYALRRVQNIGLVPMVLVVKALLDAGAEVSANAKKYTKEAAETFEFHRSNFASDSVDETAAACLRLCTTLGVEPPPQRLVYDGTSPIIATAKTPGARHEELWNLLVPSSGACTTVQGEVIRISGRIADEWHRNGGANWDRDYAAMAKAFVAHVSSQSPLASDDLEACKGVVKALRQDPESTDRLMLWAVEWVEKNPEPVRLETPSYQR